MKGIENFKTIADFYMVNRLSDLLTKEEIQVMTAGFSDQIDQPIAILEFDENNQLIVYEPYRIEDFLHPRCVEAREQSLINYRQQQTEALRNFIKNGEFKLVSFCWGKALHLRVGIKIGGIRVALALGGGYQVINDGAALSTEDKMHIEEAPLYTDEKIKEIDRTGYSFILEDRKGELITLERYKKEYHQFASKVKLIEDIARDTFRSRRYDIENEFFDKLRPRTYLREFHLPKEVEEFKTAYRWSLKQINTLYGYSSSVLMMYSKDGKSFKIYLSTLEPLQEVTVGNLRIDTNWEKCFQWGKPIYVQPDLDMSLLQKRSQINTSKLVADIQKLFPFITLKQCCLFPFEAEDNRLIFFFFYEKEAPPFEDFFRDNRRLMETFCNTISNAMSRAFAEMDRREYLDRVAHETMNPIGKVKWHAENIKIRYNQIEKKDIFRKLEDIISECNRAVNNAEKILKLSGKMKIELRPENFDFFEKIAKPIVHEVKYGREDLFIDYTELVKMPLLYIDFNLLYDVMFNILHNAVRYSAKCTTIVFSYESKEDGIVISVSNIGIGIPESEDEKIFKPGVRGSNASQVDVRGTGQGLSICKMNIEEILGGKFWFERGQTTAQGKEIIFKVFLPKTYIAGGGYGKNSND